MQTYVRLGMWSAANIGCPMHWTAVGLMEATSGILFVSLVGHFLLKVGFICCIWQHQPFRSLR
jgi:hypothetical protein